VLTEYEENHIKKNRIYKNIKYKMVACEIENVEPQHFCNLLPPFNLPPFYSMAEMQ